MYWAPEKKERSCSSIKIKLITGLNAVALVLLSKSSEYNRIIKLFLTNICFPNKSQSLATKQKLSSIKEVRKYNHQ